MDAVLHDIRGSEGGLPAAQTGRSDGVSVPNSEASKTFKWLSWVVYDQNFRQEAAGNDDVQWAKLSPVCTPSALPGRILTERTSAGNAKG